MFKKYNSIENTYREEFLEKIKGHGFWNETYVVQEKVHGANLSFWTVDGINFYTAKRTANLTVEDKFFNHQTVLDSLQVNLQNIWKSLINKFPDLKQMTVFGELIGGFYPHPEVKADSKAVKVQKGVAYSPHNSFYAFDILINLETYLDVDITNTLFEQENILYAKTLFSGSLEQCLNHSNAFDSTIPQELKLPKITPNICEGVIIKPFKTKHFNNGLRVILKNKNENWSEKKKFGKSIKRQEKVSDKVSKLREAILTYVTENRLDNVLSKIGPVSKKDFGLILGSFNKDIVDDFIKDYQSIVDDLEKKEVKQVTKSFSKIAAGMINQHLNQL